MKKKMLSTLVLMVVLLINLSSSAQSKFVKGRILDDIGSPLPGVSITVTGIKGGVVSGIDGVFEINVPPQSKLLVSMVGFENTEVSVDGKETVEVKLHKTDQQLTEVVV